MFRWCSYCQRWLGESAPLDDYRITHGTCDACAGRIEAGDSYPVKGLELFKHIFAAARAADFAACRGLAEEALSMGWRPSDAAVGLLQPALYEIGRLWSEGRVTVAEEHQFTSWCDRALTLLEDRAPQVPGPSRVLLCSIEGNAHTLGPRMASLYLRDRGFSVRTLVPGLPDADILEACRREKPDLLGLSVSMAAGLANARSVAARAAELPRPPRVVTGGLAARLPEAAGLALARTAAEMEAYFG